MGDVELVDGTGAVVGTLRDRVAEQEAHVTAGVVEYWTHGPGAWSLGGEVSGFLEIRGLTVLTREDRAWILWHARLAGKRDLVDADLCETVWH